LEALFQKSFLISSQKQGKNKKTSYYRNKLHATLYDSQQLKQSCVFVLVLKKTMKIEKVNTLFLIFMILTFVSLPFVQCSSSSEFSTKSLFISFLLFSLFITKIIVLNIL
jgi:hypothetical protein